MFLYSKGGKAVCVTSEGYFGGNSAVEIHHYCSEHSPLFDEVNRLHFPPSYYRERVPCDKDGTPLGYIKETPAASS